MTKQVEYRGEMIELTESLSHLPAGGQVLLSDTTSQRTAGRLHEIHLPAFTFQCAKGSLSRAQSKMSFEGLRPALSKGLVSSVAHVLSPSVFYCTCGTVRTSNIINGGGSEALKQVTLLKAKGKGGFKASQASDSAQGVSVACRHRSDNTIHGHAH